MAKKKPQQVADTAAADDTLGGRIQKAREARGLSTSQLALRVGVMPRTVQFWETDRSEPRANKLQMLAGVLNVPLLWMLDGHVFEPGDDTEVNVDETANIENKVDRLLELHQQSSKLIFELQSEVRRLQSEIDSVQA